MSSINYALLSGDDTQTTPPEGIHSAYLMAARLQLGDNDFIVTEWQAGSYWWETLFGFNARRMKFTQAFLDGLGINRKAVMDDDSMRLALAKAQGQVYSVRVERNGEYVNTYIEDRQVPMTTSDAPADTRGLPPAGGVVESTAQPVPADDDIPF
jgi:hypothetical protein